VTRLKEALAGADGAVIGRLAIVALALAVSIIGWFAAGALEDIKGGIAMQRAETAALRDLVAFQSAAIQAISARLDGTDRAQAIMDAAQDRRLDALEDRVGRIE
jgi:hypothetical protein